MYQRVQADLLIMEQVGCELRIPVCAMLQQRGFMKELKELIAQIESQCSCAHNIWRKFGFYHHRGMMR